MKNGHVANLPEKESKSLEVNGHSVVYIKCSAFLVVFSPFQYCTQLHFYSK